MPRRAGRKQFVGEKGVKRGMLCSNCKKKFAVHTVKDGDGEIHLCGDCYERLGYAAEFVGEDIFAAFRKPGQAEEKRCPSCGTSFSDYSRTGLLGCAECYEVFSEELIPSIRMHGKTQHIGKRPLGDDVLFELRAEQKSLRAELELAIKEKRMKDAERINRAIREITRAISEDFGGGDD